MNTSTTTFPTDALCLIEPGITTSTYQFVTPTSDLPHEIHKYVGDHPAQLVWGCPSERGIPSIQIWGNFEADPKHDEINYLGWTLLGLVHTDYQREWIARRLTYNRDLLDEVALKIYGRVVVSGFFEDDPFKLNSGRIVPLTSAQKEALMIILDEIQTKSQSSPLWASNHSALSLPQEITNSYRSEVFWRSI